MDRFHRFQQRRDEHWFEDAAIALSQATTKRRLGEVFYSLTSREGYQNLALAEVSNGSIVDAAWLRLPAGFVETYMAEGWAEHDPVLKHATRVSAPFAWSDLMESEQLAPAQLKMMAAAASRGVHSGHTIPFHDACGGTTLISLSLRGPDDSADPDRTRLLKTLALFCLSRLADLDRAEMRRQSPAPPASGVSPTNGPGAHNFRELLRAADDDPFKLSPRHLRQLVLVELGLRRWKMGLRALGTRIFDNRDAPEIVDLERWGLIVETTDDERWLFHLAPSALGSSYLRRRLEVEYLRRQLRDTEIDKNEVPDTADIG